MILLYRGSKNGWNIGDFHDLCDNKGATITLFKSSKGKIFGGFTSLSWESKGWFGNFGEKDNSAFLFSVSDKNTFHVTRDQYAVCHYSNYGPYFYKGIEVTEGPMNKENAAKCQISGHYNIKALKDGNSALTGDGAKNKNSFTIVELEVFKVI